MCIPSIVGTNRVSVHIDRPETQYSDDPLSNTDGPEVPKDRRAGGDILFQAADMFPALIVSKKQSFHTILARIDVSLPQVL